MKRIPPSIITPLSQAKLFLDDLEEIDKILTESWSSYILTIDEYELNSIHEITQIEGKQDFNKLEIRLTEPRFSLILDGRPFGVSYISSSKDNQCIGTIERIKPIIKKRIIQQKYFIFFSIFLFLLIFVDFLNKNYNLYSGLIEDIVQITKLLLAVAIVLFVIGDFFIRTKWKGIIVFTNKRSNQQPNYFTRNKDQLITVLISGVISGIIGIVVGFSLAWFKFKLTGKCSF
jgi:hypothetical protein